MSYDLPAAEPIVGSRGSEDAKPMGSRVSLGVITSPIDVARTMMCTVARLILSRGGKRPMQSGELCQIWRAPSQHTGTSEEGGRSIATNSANARSGLMMI